MSDTRRFELDPLAPPPPRVIEDNSHRVGRALRPKGLHTKHLTALERFRVRTLYYDAGLSRDRVHQITGYSKNQIRTAVRAKSAAVGKRPGRPKKFGGVTLSGAGLPTSSSSDADAELIQQAQTALAREGFMLTTGESDDHGGNRGSEEDEDGEDEDYDENDHLAPNPSAVVSAPEALPPVMDSRSPVNLWTAAEPRRRGFNDLPPDIRVSIWRCVLSTAPTQVPPSRSWAVAVLPHQPWLELGVSPPDIKLENPPWSHYVDTRHVPATILTRVNREARRVVLERCTPIMVSRSIRESSKGSPVFIWVDRRSDVMHFFGKPFRPDLFEMAGRSACPELYRSTSET
ncbi:hypothetical protein F4861DRAFT_524355 [Xylaria intraflava]|nr:hypothetical protein F4861DRAFT_524355 [Xylaria intraflava]